MKPVLDTAVPALVIVSMSIVGLGLTVADFRRVIYQRRLVLAAILGQLLMVPLAGQVVVRLLGPDPAVAGGLLMVAACPAGPLANVLNHLARANVALSVAVTAVSCLAGVVTVPLILAVDRVALGNSTAFSVPVSTMVGQLTVTLVLPIVGGMAVRRAHPAVAERYQPHLAVVNLMAVLLLVGLVIVHANEGFASVLAETAAAAVTFAGLSAVAGWATAWVTGATPTDRFTIATVFVVRNVSVATVIAVTVLGRVEFAVFAAAYFVCQVPLLLTAVVVFRSFRVAEMDMTAEASRP
jgi:bile acid:Na+ symporter, BASS family